MKCPICNGKRSFFKSLCHDCQRLFNVVHQNLGKVGLSGLMDKLIETGIDKKKILHFLNTDPQGKGSVMDQITAQLTNNLAEGMGVKESDMKPEDVKRIRENPLYGVSNKPLDK
jgi:hypothetical protein